MAVFLDSRYIIEQLKLNICSLSDFLLRYGDLDRKKKKERKDKEDSFPVVEAHNERRHISYLQ